MFSLRRFSLLFALLISLCAPPAFATVVIPVTDADLARQADVIVVGVVTHLQSAWEHTVISTEMTFSVDEVLKGSLPGRSVTVAQAGGIVDDVQFWIDGTPEFTVGEKALLFLAQKKDGRLTVLHMYQGKFSVFMDTDSGVEMAYREAHPVGVHILESDGRSTRAATESAHGFLPFADLKANIRDALSHPHVTPSVQPMTPVTEGADRESSSFTLLSAPPVRWFEPDSGQPVTMRMNPIASPTGATEAIQAALMAWSGVYGSSFRFDYGGLTTAAGLRYDGENAVSFGDPLGQISPPFVSEVNPLTGRPLCRGVLAIGGYFRSESITTVVNGHTYYQILEGDLVFADGWDGCDTGLSNALHVAEIATHELGHVIGLGHSDDADATMYAYAHFDGRGADIRADDGAGLRFLYPARAMMNAMTKSAWAAALLRSMRQIKYSNR